MAALASLESPEMVDAIKSSSDLRESKKTVEVLESLLNKAELRVANLEIWEKQKGLRYKGKDAVKCNNNCRNTFQSGGKYSAKCDKCPAATTKEVCVDCIFQCPGTCGTMLCGNCVVACDHCEELLCEECMGTCSYCGKKFCNRDTADGGGECCILVDQGKFCKMCMHI